MEKIPLLQELCEQSNESLGSIKGMECFIQMSDYQLSKHLFHIMYNTECGLSETK
jgi:hypothetical protein